MKNTNSNYAPVASAPSIQMLASDRTEMDMNKDRLTVLKNGLIVIHTNKRKGAHQPKKERNR